MSRKVIATIAMLMVTLVGVAFATGQRETAAQTAVIRQGTGPSWTWDTSPVTLSMYVHEGWYNKQWDVQSTLLDRYVTDKTGVRFEITTPAGEGAERLNAMIAAGDLPDIVTIGWYEEQFPLLQSSGMVRPLTRLIDEYAPTFWDIIPESMKLWYTYEDGNWYGFPGFFWAPEHITEETFLETNQGMIARQDLMEQLGIVPEDFTTQDRMIEALRKVRDANITYNGRRVTPVNLGNLATSWHSVMINFPDFFAIPREDRDGNLVDRRYHPKFLEAMQFINLMYREGFISRDNFTMQRAQVEEAISAGAVFLAIVNIADYKTPMTNLYQFDNAAMMVPVGPVLARDGAQPFFSPRAFAGWTVSMVSANARRADRAIRFFEYAYSEEGQLALQYGVPGVTFNMVDGRVQYTEEFLAEQERDSAAAWARHGANNFWWFYRPPFHQMVAAEPEPPALGYNMDRYFGQFAFPDMAWANTDPPGGTEEAIIRGEAGVFWEEQIPRMIMAGSAAEVEQIWRAALQRLDAMGWQQTLAYQNRRFQENKERLNLDFAWPPNRR
ncbi:MAG: extracellular solute-binding protein [Spirochaetaceae bacterium]|nr:MAG: extracellular solute-binding protein [Spirochaetaceae bacterium]